MKQLILLRHGQSQWNLEQRLTGWTDVSLTEKGAQEARAAGRRLRDQGLLPDAVHTSMLGRAMDTARLVLGETGRIELPLRSDWRLNERHYGALTGRSWSEFEGTGDAGSTPAWTRSFAAAPPPWPDGDPDDPANAPRYDGHVPGPRPNGESLQALSRRVVTCWEERIRLDVVAGKRVLVVGHGNALGVLLGHLRQLDEEEILRLELTTGTPVVLELGAGCTVATHVVLRAEATD